MAAAAFQLLGDRVGQQHGERDADHSTSTNGKLPQSLPCQMSAPRPLCAATISADSTQDQEIARVIFSLK